MLVTLLCLTGLAAHATSAAEIKITSFNIVAGTHVADLCATMTPAPTGPTAVQVLVDKGSKEEGHYNTLIGSDGKFCINVTTYSGQAEVTILK